MYQIDLNSDLGEGFGAYKMGMDQDIIKCVSSVNVACGYHAGDPVIMEKTVKTAKQYNVAVGAHPGYPDLMGFGRRAMKLSPEEVKCIIKYQVGALMAFTQSEGLKLQHVAPHGALGNLCQYDREVSKAICEAVYEIDPSIMIYYCAGAVLGEEAKNIGLVAKSEIFVDRGYMDDLSLVPRSQEGAMITDEDIAIERTIRMVKEGKVTARSGKELEIAGDTLCVHGDGPKALEFVAKIRKAFESEGIIIKNFQS